MPDFFKEFYVYLAWIYTIICCVLGAYCRRNPIDRLGGLGQPLPNPICFVVSVLLYVPFSGLRTDAGDTVYYLTDFENEVPDGIIDFSLSSNSGYTFISQFLVETSHDPHHLTLLTASLALIPVLWIIYKYSHPYDLAIYLFMATGYFGLSMNGIRQYCAAGIMVLGTKFLFSTKKTAIIKYAVVVLLAVWFHSSAFIMLFIFWFVRRKAWKASSFMLLFLSLIGLALFDLVLPSFLGALEDTSYSDYAANGWFTGGTQGSSFVRVFVSAVPVVLAYFSRARMRQLGFVGDVLTNLSFINMAIYVISSYNWIFARLAIYLSVYYIIFLAWVVYNGVQKKDRALYYTVCVALYYYYSGFEKYAIVSYMSDVYFPDRKIF